MTVQKKSVVITPPAAILILVAVVALCQPQVTTSSYVLFGGSSGSDRIFLLPYQQKRSHDFLFSLRGGASSAAATTTTKVHNPVAAEAHSKHEEHLMSPFTAVANILADLCPHGMMPLAFGLAAGGGTGPLVGVVTLLFFGFLSWYSLLSYGRAADAVLEPDAHQDSLAAVWAEAIPNGSKTTYIPNYGCALLTFGCLLFYSAFIGDLFGSLAIGLLPAAVPNIFKKRASVLLLLHAIPILPLCLLKDLSALKYSSLTGLMGIFYTIYFVWKRWAEKSYDVGGKFFLLMKSSPHLQPKALADFPGRNLLTDTPLWHVGKGIITLMNMCCVAFACHYNAVKYFMELKDRRVRPFGYTMLTGVAGTAAVFIAMMIFGFATFGANTQTLLLNNYHTAEDGMANIARFFTGLAIISGYPLMFAGLKSAAFSITGFDKKGVVNRERKETLLSVAMVTVVAITSCFVTEHELATVIGVVGSIFGSFVIYMLPGYLNNCLLLKKKTPSSSEPIITPFFRGERAFNNVLVVFGCVFAVLGTWVSIAGESDGNHH